MTGTGVITRIYGKSAFQKPSQFRCGHPKRPNPPSR
jgi:hypothetical protein